VHRKNIDTDIACIFDPFGNAVHTALAVPVLGEDVLITGSGPIGIMAAAVARHAGARHVVIDLVGPYEERPQQIENFARKVLPLLTDLRGG